MNLSSQRLFMRTFIYNRLYLKCSWILLFRRKIAFQMYLKFHVCYSLKNLQVVDNYDLTFDHYLHGEFLFDVVASLPLELFCLAYAPGKRLSRLSYLRLIRMLRMKRVRELFSKWLSKLNIK